MHELLAILLFNHMKSEQFINYFVRAVVSSIFSLSAMY